MEEISPAVVWVVSTDILEGDFDIHRLGGTSIVTRSACTVAAELEHPVGGWAKFMFLTLSDGAASKKFSAEIPGLFARCIKYG